VGTRKELSKVDIQAALPAPAQPASPAEAPVSPPPAGLGVTAPPPAGEGIDPDEKAPRSFHLSRQVLERARAAAQYLSGLPGADGPTTISELVERALRRELERLEREHNEGLPFPAVRGRMRTGPGAAGAERIRRAQRARHRNADGD
jgi:Centromere-binding protein ParB C-terminal